MAETKEEELAIVDTLLAEISTLRELIYDEPDYDKREELQDERMLLIAKVNCILSPGLKVEVINNDFKHD